MIPLTVSEIKRLLAAPPAGPPGGNTARWTGGAGTRPDHAGTTSAHGWPETLESPWSASEWLLPY